MADSFVQDSAASHFHPLTLALTAPGSDSYALEDLNIQFQQILKESFQNNEVLLKIMRTIAIRIEEMKGIIRSGSASSKVLCIRLMDLMRHLLIHGPHCFASDFVGHIAALR